MLNLPGGQSPHWLEPLELMHWTKGETEHPPLLMRHSLTSSHTKPFPVNPVKKSFDVKLTNVCRL